MRRVREAMGLLVFLGLTQSLIAQDFPEESAPSVGVPSLPDSAPVGQRLEEEGVGEVCPPPNPVLTPILDAPAVFPFVPFMLGDFIGPLANPMTDLKASEGESPVPLDRVFYRFNYYNSLDPSRYQSQFSPFKQVNLFTNVFGFEKTFGEWFSFGLRIPLNGVQALSRGPYYIRRPGGAVVQQPAVPTYQSFILGNINSLFKVKLFEDRNAGYLVSGGMAISFPTASNFTIDPGPSTAAMLQPFLGYLYARNRFFVQGFTAFTVPIVSVQPLILFQDLGIGMWAYRNETDSAFLTGIAPTFECHLNVPLQGANRIVPVFQRAGYTGFNTQFNLTFGGTFEFRHRGTLGMGLVVPTVGPNPFLLEFLAHFNWRF